MFATLYSLATDLANNKPAAEEMTLGMGNVPADGETVSINGVTYEFDNDATITLGNTLVTIGADTDETASNLSSAINSEQGLGNTDVTASVLGSTLTLVSDKQGAGTLSFTDGTGGDLSITIPTSIPLYDHLSQIDTALNRILDVRSQIGARLNVIDSQNEINQDFLLSIQQTKSQVEDLDMAEAISQFNLQIVSLQAAQQAFIRVQSLSLFDRL